MLDVIARFLADSGPFMIPLVALGGWAAAVVAERLHFYYVTCRRDAVAVAEEVGAAVFDGDADRARELATAGSSPLHVLLRTALEGYLAGQPMDAVRRSVEETSLREVPRLGTRLDYLVTIANAATLVGLLGTIFGLQTAFASLAVADAAAKAALLATGISQAMNTTALGLIVAIPCMLVYAKLSARRTALVDVLDAGTVHLLNAMETWSGRGAPRPGAGSSDRTPTLGALPIPRWLSAATASEGASS